jgi:hypothetical protein
VDIEEWLRRLDLPQYIKAFADNAIDADDLREIAADRRGL